MIGPTCARCGARADTIDNIAETRFKGLVQTKTETVTQKWMRVACISIKGHGRDERRIQADEEKPLCDPCWSLLVGKFLQGRAVAPVDHAHEWRRGGQIGSYPREVCDLCMNDRIAQHEEGSAS